MIEIEFIKDFLPEEQQYLEVAQATTYMLSAIELIMQSGDDNEEADEDHPELNQFGGDQQQEQKSSSSDENDDSSSDDENSEDENEDAD